MELGDKKASKRERLDPDNPDQELIHICQMKASKILNPIIDWTDSEVWEFIKGNNLRYCELYDKGYSRLGCIGCPMSTHQVEELEQYPKIKDAYMRAFQKMLDNGDESKRTWKTKEDVYEWWIGQK